ncbi:MAG: DUF4956 domain-containing protein [Anaerolineae bacterium]|nr:DUF4956 domain-containing protein [Gemmatimonadaceae bacterium]
MHAQTDKDWATRLRGDLVLRIVLYYALLGGVIALLWRFGRDRIPFFLASSSNSLFGSADAGAAGFLRQGTAGDGQAHLGIPAAIAMVSAVLLALPVAWLYTLTRRKRGYQQSVVQTLVLLPLVVSGVVVLVKNSLPLAFSLAGIVAAVRFRNTLEDSKDAVYIFLATGIGLAAGVDLSVAAALSVVFNLITLWLWQADFGRSAALAGPAAQRRMQRALAIANRTGEFVARVDSEILANMAPEQLDALADRAWRRRKRNDAEVSEDDEATYDKLLRIRTLDPETVRALIEPGLAGHEQIKRWRFGGVVHEEDGTHNVEYGIKLRKNADRDQFVESLRNAQGVIDVELR